MRKITSLLALLLLFVGSAWAQPDVTGKTFTLNCKRGYVYFNGTQLAGTSDATAASKFAIVSYDSNTYLYDATQKAFVCHTTAATAGLNGNAALESNNDFSKVVKNISFGSTSISNYPWYVQEDEFGNWLNMDGSPKVYFNTWKDFESGNGGNTYAVTIVDNSFDATEAVAMLDAYFNPSATVTYVISDANGVVYTSEASPATVGATITSLPSDLQRPYCSYTVTSTNIVAGANTVQVTVTYSGLPFTISTDFDNATWYYATLRGTKYVRADDNAKDSNGRYQTSTTNEKTDVYKWAFMGTPYGFYVVNKGQGAGKYLYAGSVPTMQAVTDPSTTTAAKWAVSSNTNGGFNLRSLTGDNLYINDASGAGNLGFWNSSWATSDNGSNWVLTEVPAEEVTVTYNVVLGGNVVATASELQAVGGAPAVPASLAFAYTTYTYDVTEITASTTTVTATPTFNMPFTTSSDYANAKWYYMHGHAYYSDRYVSTNGTAVAFSQGKGTTDAYKWAFIGNPVEGIKIINKATGDAYYVDGTNPVTMSTNAKVWTLKQQTTTSWNSGENGFGFYDASLTYMNCRTSDNNIQYWSQFDQGSTYWVEEVPAVEAEYAQAIAELKAIPFGTGLNQYSFTGDYAGYTSQAATIIDGLETQGYTADNLTIAQGLLANYALNMPYGKFIKLYNAARGAWIGAAATGKHPNASDADNAGIYFVTTDGQMVSYAYGKALQNAAGAPCVATNGTGGTFEFADAGNGNYYVKCGGYLVAWTSASDRLQAPDDYAKFTLTEVTELPLTLTDVSTYGVNGYYTTMFLPVNVTVSGAKVYTVTDNVNNSLTVDELADGDVVPANTAVVLEGTSGSATATVTTTDGSATSVLTGSVYAIATTEAANPYVLSVANNTLGFYKFAGETLNGFRAFYNAPSNADPTRGFVLNFGETTTGISSAVLNGSDKAYDLQGRRVNNAQKGVFIINGKKVVK